MMRRAPSPDEDVVHCGARFAKLTPPLSRAQVTAALRGDKARLALRSWMDKVDEAKHLGAFANRWQNPTLTRALLVWSYRAEELAIMKLGTCRYVIDHDSHDDRSWPP